MSANAKLSVKMLPKEPVLCERCCCGDFVPGWCCRPEVYQRRLAQALPPDLYQMRAGDPLFRPGEDD